MHESFFSLEKCYIADQGPTHHVAVSCHSAENVCRFVESLDNVVLVFFTHIRYSVLAAESGSQSGCTSDKCCRGDVGPAGLV